MTNKLINIKTFDQLIRYLEEELDWPCQEYGFEDLTFQYSPQELGIKDEDSVQIKQIHQLRPFFQGQPWGIFFIEFEKKRLPVALLRRVLSHLVIKKRASANKAEKAVWSTDNLLFISAFGDETAEQREIAFAHFSQESGDLPTLRVLGWDGADTVLKMEFVDQQLHEKLCWPKNPKDTETWKNQWSSAFRHKPGHVIRTADALADRLAGLARSIRAAAETLMAHESEQGHLRKLHKAFQTALIHDLTETDFADTYAQTITYGLLTAAISRTDMSSGASGTALVAGNVTDMVPITNPFLKEMLETFINAGDHKGGIQFDELGIQDVVDLLRGEETDLPAILRDFNNKAPGEDPVIHFYEHFLSSYNKKLKVQRGVFYTPKPVVSYIVRSVHELLKTEFGLEDGLADTTTWGEMEKKIPGLQRPETVGPNSPFVMILDPAVGTATFLVEVIDVVFKTLTVKWERQHLHKTAQAEAWNEYVPRHLLPRLFGYELMMAPYAIAHMKIGLKLFETGYRFGSLERVRIFLTNSLEPASDAATQQTFVEMAPALAHEAMAVNDVKRNVNFSILVGNPPYSGNSANPSKDSTGKLNFIGKLINNYFFVDGKPLGEKNPKWLQDDYVKFIRFGEYSIKKTGRGILAYITNHGYLDNPTFRGMRQHLTKTFSEMYLLDLHGNSKKKEVAIDGTKDENVFDIQQGVAIVIAIINSESSNLHDEKIVKHSTINGLRKIKYSYLLENSIVDIDWTVITPESKFYLFLPKIDSLSLEYEQGWSIGEIMPENLLGFQTHHDEIAISFDEINLKQQVDNYLKTKVGDIEWKKWSTLCTYRPFDTRHCYLAPTVSDRSRLKIMKHLYHPNKALAIGKQGLAIGAEEWNIIFCSSFPVDANVFRRGGANIFPLYLYNDLQFQGNSLLNLLNYDKQPNLTQSFIKTISNKTSLRFTPIGAGDLLNTFGPEDIFNNIYAIFHSTNYRKRYSEYLKIDFPRLPLTSDLQLFRKICGLGSTLVALHQLDAPEFSTQLPKFTGAGDNFTNIGFPKYEGLTVLINPTQGFEVVPQDVWEFNIGGYQVCRKWLKDRRGRQLSEEDIAHYQKIIVALKETIRIMGEIDEVIEEHGGWPIK